MFCKITTSNNFLIDGNGTNGGNAIFTAGGEITLKEFTVKRGGEFHAKYGPPLLRIYLFKEKK